MQASQYFIDLGSEPLTPAEPALSLWDGSHAVGGVLVKQSKEPMATNSSVLLADRNCGLSLQVTADLNALCWKPPTFLSSSSPLSTSMDFPKGWASPSLSAVPSWGSLPLAHLADPRHHRALPVVPSPWAGCRCRHWARSISSALGCEQAAGHSIRRGRSCCILTLC